MRKLRKTAEVHDIRYAIQVSVTNALSATDLYQSCLTCKRFNQNSEICGLYNQRPPARIIVNACKDYVDVEDDIPF